MCTPRLNPLRSTWTLGDSDAFVDGNKDTILGQMLIMNAAVCGGAGRGRGYMGCSVPSSQLCCAPKTSLNGVLGGLGGTHL
jgi:hypothetical protein